LLSSYVEMNKAAPQAIQWRLFLSQL
jgi:hypothetical protein